MNECVAPQFGHSVGVVELVEPEALVAALAVDQRVGEVLQVARGLPHRGRREDGGIEADDVVAELHHRPPPGVLDVAQQQHADRAVVVGRAEPAVDLGRREHEAPTLRQVDDLLHQIGGGGVGVGGGGGIRHGGRCYRPARTPLPADSPGRRSARATMARRERLPSPDRPHRRPRQALRGRRHRFRARGDRVGRRHRDRGRGVLPRRRPLRLQQLRQLPALHVPRDHRRGRAVHLRRRAGLHGLRLRHLARADGQVAGHPDARPRSS